MAVPSTIFIVPYRNREAHLSMYIRYMPWILEVSDISSTYEVIVAHQSDERPFNRGAMKNLGFIAAKQMYPHHYKDITFIFQDVDTLPGLRNMISFKTEPGKIHHYYGYPYALGGIFSVKGADFEKINGFPNYWGWGFEDNCIQHRWYKHGGIIIRDKEFFRIGDSNILQFSTGRYRNIDAEIIKKLKSDTGVNGIISISKIGYTKVEIQSKVIMINFNSWEVPEKSDEVLLENKEAPMRVVQNTFSMNLIMHSANIHNKRQNQIRR